MRLELLRQLLSGYQGHLAELGLSPHPLFPAFARVDNKIFLEPLLVLSAHLLKEDVPVYHLLVLLHEEEE